MIGVSAILKVQSPASQPMGDGPNPQRIEIMKAIAKVMPNFVALILGRLKSAVKVVTISVGFVTDRIPCGRCKKSVDTF